LKPVALGHQKQGLNDPVCANGCRQIPERLVVESRTWLDRTGLYSVNINKLN
jgi:hypothetical protein